MDPAVYVGSLIGGGGIVTAAIALYRARADKTAVVSGTHNDLMEAAVATAKGLAEASAMVVEPLRTELTNARERIAVVEKHARNCDEKLDALGQKFATLEASVKTADSTTHELLVLGTEARDAAVDARKEVVAQQEERTRVQERDRKADEA